MRGILFKVDPFLKVQHPHETGLKVTAEHWMTLGQVYVPDALPRDAP